MNRGLTNDRLIANLTTAFGLVALLLACLGLYGTISYGRRVAHPRAGCAHGARRRSRDGGMDGRARGTYAGWHWRGARSAAGLRGGRSVLSLLHGVTAADRVSYSQATVLLLVVAGIAAYLPARRAARIDPMTALRAE